MARLILTTATSPILLGLLLWAMAATTGAMPAQAHHRHTYYFHWDNFPNAGAIPVYNCSANATTLQTAINNWNANGGIGTIFSYAGVNCNPSTGIVAVLASGLPGVAAFDPKTWWVWRKHEVLKDGTQSGREWFFGSFEGQVRIYKAELQVESSVLTSVNVYAHELGHAVGLNEHYVDILDNQISCVTYPGGSIMDCPDANTGPTSHDAADASGRYGADPWGPGAVWITNAQPNSLTLNWGEINDNETNYQVYRTTAPGIGGQVLIGSPGRDSQTFGVTGLTSGQQYCFHLKVYRGSFSGYSSQICRNTQPSAPGAPSAPAVFGGPNNYTADLYWTINDSTYTHSFITVYSDSSGISPMARYYIPYNGTGTKQKFITLGHGDSLPQTYYFYVSTCNAKWNAYNVPPNTCTTNASYGSLYMSN